MDNPKILFKRLSPDTSDVPLPKYMTINSAGMDICAGVEGDTVIEPGRVMAVPTGFAMAIPPGFEAQVRPRSGLAIKHSIGVINSPGTIDADYRGEVGVLLINFGSQPFVVKRGDRIAQMIINRVYHAELETVENLDETERGDGGFGHTGV